MCPLPPRHDLPPDSSAHETVSLIDSFIKELCVRVKDAEMLDISSLWRKHFTTQGLHLRASGKSKLAELIVQSFSRMNPKPAETSGTPDTETLSTPLQTSSEPCSLHSAPFKPAPDTGAGVSPSTVTGIRQLPLHLL